MPDKPGFEINGRFYASPESFRLGDAVLVTEVTGLDWDAFTRALDEQSGRDAGDPVAMLGLLAVAIWQANPRWRRAQVVRVAESVKIDEVRFVGGDADEEGADAGPPNGGEAGAKSSSSSVNGSPGSPDIRPEQPSLTSPGAPGSDTGFPE